jgi:prophage regulatory protein
MVQSILRRPDVERATGLPRSSLYALIAAKKFPKPIKLGGKSSGWLEAEIIEWQRARAAERDTTKRAGRRQRKSNSGQSGPP